MTWRKGPKVEVQCEVCGEAFMALIARRKKGWDRFCSISCANSWRATEYQRRGKESNLALPKGIEPYRRTNSRSKFKEAAREAVNHTCQVCNKKQVEPRLVVHRLIRSVFGGKYERGQVVVCCRSCHMKLERARC